MVNKNFIEKKSKLQVLFQSLINFTTRPVPEGYFISQTGLETFLKSQMRGNIKIIVPLEVPGMLL